MPCWTRCALRGRSGSAPEASRGRSGGSRGGLGDLSGASGDGPWTPESDLFECRSDFGGALGGDGQKKQYVEGFGAVLLRCFLDALLFVSVLVLVALESSRGKSDTIEFDDPYKGIATFLFAQEDETAEQTCRETYEFRRRARSAR